MPTAAIVEAMTDKPDDVAALIHEARKALHCLYLAVESSIADDVSNKCIAAINALAAENAKLKGALEVIEMETRDGGQWGFAEINECARAAIDAAIGDTKGTEECEHEWVSIVNPVIKNGSMCTKCGALKP